MAPGPHRHLFPLGAALAVVAVLPFALGGRGGGSLALFHSVAQVQGFLTCFAVGFLYSLLPERTGARPPDGWEVAAALALPPATVLCAWADEPAMASGLWLALLAAAMIFTLRRLRSRSARRAFPPALLWVPISLATGAAGAALVAGASRLAPTHALEVWAIGRGLLVQGFATGLVLGVGSVLLPPLTRGEEPGPGPEPGPPRPLRLGLHALAAAAFLASFPLEVLGESPRLAFALRAAVCAAVLMAAAGAHRLPRLPGLHRWLVFAASWLVPAGFLVGALGPRFRGAALHVLFVGGFAQVALAVSTHLVLERGQGRAPRPAAGTLALRAMALFLAAAFGARVAAALDLRHVAPWLGVAAVSFCAAIAAWLALVGRSLLGRLPAPALSAVSPPEPPAGPVR